MSTVLWKDVPTRTVDVHEEFVPEALAFLNGSGETSR